MLETAIVKGKKKKGALQLNPTTILCNVKTRGKEYKVRRACGSHRYTFSKTWYFISQGSVQIAISTCRSYFGLKQSTHMSDMRGFGLCSREGIFLNVAVCDRNGDGVSSTSRICNSGVHWYIRGTFAGEQDASGGSRTVELRGNMTSTASNTFSSLIISNGHIELFIFIRQGLCYSHMAVSLLQRHGTCG